MITGAAGGIGSVLSKKLILREKASLLLVDKDRDRLEALKADLLSAVKSGESQEVDIHLFAADLTSEDSFINLCAEVADHEIDVLINNAGIVYSGLFKEMDMKDFDRVLDINLKASIHLTRALLPKLMKSRGFIVNVASGGGLSPLPGMCAYSTSKFGLVGFSEGLRGELRGIVGVSTICPAFVATGIMKNSLVKTQLDSDEASQHKNKLDQVFHRIGSSPEKVADIIIRSIKKNRGLVPIGFPTHFFYNLRKFLPGLVDRLNSFLVRKMHASGLLK